jgi:hypothetical protein
LEDRSRRILRLIILPWARDCGVRRSVPGSTNRCKGSIGEVALMLPCDARMIANEPRLSRGFVTSADMAGATTAQIMDVTGHRDPKSLRRYTRRELLHDPVLPKLFEP